MKRLVASKGACRVWFECLGGIASAMLAIGAVYAAADVPHPCLLVYDGSVTRVGAVKLDLPESKVPGRDIKRLVDDCVGLELIKGRAEAIIWTLTKDRNGVEQEHFSRIPMTAHRPIGATELTEKPGNWAKLDSLIRGLDALFSPDQVNAASRGGEDARLLKEMLADTLVVPPGGLRLPLSDGVSRRVESVVIETESLPPRVVGGVTLADHVLAIPPGALLPGKAYRWKAVVRGANDSTTVEGVFDVAAADDELARRLAARGPQDDANVALADAAWYLAHDLKANATIAMAQWYSRSQ